MSKEISPSLLSRETTQECFLGEEFWRKDSAKTNETGNLVFCSYTAGILFPTPIFYMRSHTTQAGSNCLWSLAAHPLLRVRHLPHPVCTALTFNPDIGCPLSFPVSYHIPKWFTYAVLSSRFLYSPIICIQLTGDTTQSAFLLKDPSCYATLFNTHTQKPKVVCAVFVSTILWWLLSHDSCSSLILQTSLSSSLKQNGIHHS